MLDDEITFNFKVSIIHCYPSKMKHSQNVHFKVKGNCYNMSPFFIQCAKLFYKFQIHYDVSLNLRQYMPISKMDSCVADCTSLLVAVKTCNRVVHTIDPGV